MMVEIRRAKSEERAAGLSGITGRAAFRFARVLQKVPHGFTLPRQVRVVGIGLILIMAVLHAQTATVIGTVTRQNNRPAANVLVLISGQYRYTDVGGRYRIDGVRVGRQKVKVSSGGKVLLEIEVNVHDALSVINLKLP